MRSSLILSLAAAAAALPQKRTPPLSNSEFHLQMRIGAGDTSTFLKLCAVQNGTDPLLYLVGDSTGSGSPAYFNGSSPNAALNIDHNGVGYGMFVGDTGDIHGIAESVPAQRGFQDTQFTYSNSSNTIYHQLTSAAPTWLYCNVTINDAVVPVLSWGSYFNNGSYPWGCATSQLSRVCDVPGSGASC